MSINSKQGYEIESESSAILEQEGYEIILEPENTRRRIEIIPKEEKEKHYKELHIKIKKYSKLLGKYSIPLSQKISEINYIEGRYLKTKDNEKFKNKIIDILDSGKKVYESWIPTGNSFKHSVEEVCDCIIRPTKIELENEYHKKIKKAKMKFKKTTKIPNRLNELETKISKTRDRIKTEEVKKIKNNFEIQILSAKLIIALREKNYLQKFLKFDFSELVLAYSRNVKMTYSRVDYFCKKNGNYYVFDIKHKLRNKGNSMLNRITVTSHEVLNYNRLERKNNVKVKIMIVLKKRNGLIYKIFNWSEFKISETYDPDKTSKISINLKDKIDLKSFKNYNFKQ